MAWWKAAAKLAGMEQTATMAGFFAAHGIWSVSEGESLIPLLGCESADGERTMQRLIADDIADGARMGQESLRDNTNGAARAVLVCDAFITLDSVPGTGRTDALIVEAVHYGPHRQSLTLAVPYRPAGSAQGFAVHRPKFVDISGVPEAEQESLADAFFAGVDSHEEAAAIWNAHLDESI